MACDGRTPGIFFLGRPAYMEVRHQNILQQGGNKSGLQMLIFCLEHFYTIRYNTFLHTFLCSTTYQKLVFYAGIPLRKKFVFFHHFLIKYQSLKKNKNLKKQIKIKIITN